MKEPLPYAILKLFRKCEKDYKKAKKSKSYSSWNYHKSVNIGDGDATKILSLVY